MNSSHRQQLLIERDEVNDLSLLYLRLNRSRCTEVSEDVSVPQSQNGGRTRAYGQQVRWGSQLLIQSVTDKVTRQGFTTSGADKGLGHVRHSIQDH